MKTFELKGEVRTDLGKKATKAIRNEGNIPAIIYGGENKEIAIHFTVTNRSILKKDFDANDPLSEVKELEYSFHVKQTETAAHARNFTSGSLRYKNTWGEFAPDVVDFHLYGGTDIESGVMFRDLITEVKPQLETFSADKDTLIAQNRLDLIPFILG